MSRHSSHKMKTLSAVIGENWSVVLLSSAILITSFGLVYLKDVNRRYFIQYQTLLHSQQQQRVLWGKLLLEQSTLSTQARIQTLAQRKLHMRIPVAKDIVIVDIPNNTNH